MKTSVRWILICFCLISIAPSGDVPSRGPVMKIRGDCSNDARLCKVNRSKKLCQKKNKNQNIIYFRYITYLQMA